MSRRSDDPHRAAEMFTRACQAFGELRALAIHPAPHQRFDGTAKTVVVQTRDDADVVPQFRRHVGVDQPIVAMDDVGLKLGDEPVQPVQQFRIGKRRRVRPLDFAEQGRGALTCAA